MNGVGNWIVGQNTTNTQNTMDLLDPAGTNKATKVVCNANAYCSLAQAISVSGNTQYTFSYWIRGTAGSDNRIYSYAGAGAIGELTARSAYSYSTTGWTRVQVTFTTNAGTTAIYVYAISKQTAPATSDTLYVWGAQLEASSAASSYIPTGTSTVQRAADSCDITGTNFSSWWPANQSEFTVLWTGDITRSPATSQFLWLTRNSGGTSRSRGYVTTGSVIRANAVALYDFTASPATNATVNTVFKNALAVRSGDSAMYVNNGTTIGSETTTTALGSGFDADKITFNPNADNFMHIRTLKFWPQRLPNATLNGLVT
jgi:hypothetical protein